MNPSEYEVMYGVEDRHWWYRALRGLLEQHWRFTFDVPPWQCLDIGCGTGANMAFLKDRVNVFGVDAAREALACCQKRGDPRVVQGSANDLPFASNSTGAALMMDVLYHRGVPDKIHALREARRVLKPGGALFINVPAYQWLHSPHDEAIHTDKRFTRGELRSLLETAGLRPVNLTYWNTFLLPPIAVIRLLRKGEAGGRSDLRDISSPLLNDALSLLMTVERALLRLVNLPLGVSIFAVAMKD